jgi:hypothetical protein
MNQKESHADQVPIACAHRCIAINPKETLPVNLWSSMRPIASLCPTAFFGATAARVAVDAMELLTEETGTRGLGGTLEAREDTRKLNRERAGH